MTNILLGTYQAIWKNVTTERKPNDRLRLVCGDQGVEIVKEDNGKGELCSIFLM